NRKELHMQTSTTLDGFSIVVGGEIAGTLYFLGVEVVSGAYNFLLCSNGEVDGLTYICEGAFDEVVRLVDHRGGSGNVFIGKRVIGRNLGLEVFDEQMRFAGELVRHLEHKIEAQQPKKK
ncbi:MAG: hypothetical protein UY00_C0006G0015, partial [Candidatus Wolfebacteria bacterium GW2011_GWA1_47_6]